MVNHAVPKLYTAQELAREWGAKAWKDTPSRVIAVPFPGGVLFGAETQDKAQRISFFLAPEDARIIGQRLVAAAVEADHATA